MIQNRSRSESIRSGSCQTIIWLRFGTGAYLLLLKKQMLLKSFQTNIWQLNYEVGDNCILILIFEQPFEAHYSNKMYRVSKKTGTRNTA